MAKIKSPGQKRKGIVRIVAVVILIIASYAGSLVYAKIKNLETAWVADHRQVHANVTELTQETVEYRNLKGRLRHREVYQVSYEFMVDGDEYGNTIEVGHAAYEALAVGSPISVWYASGDPALNDSQSNVQATMDSNNTVENMIDVAPYTIPGTLVVYWLLMIVFVRESKNALPEGFYTENSWLDIDDKYVVWLDGEDLVYFNFDDKRADAVQDAYQNGAGLEELLVTSKAGKFKRVSLPGVTCLTSAHNSDVMVIEVGEERHTIEFLNRTVKAEALDRIKPHIPDNLQHGRVEKTRLQAAMPWIVTLAVMIAGLFYFEMFLVQLAIGFAVMVWIVPKIFSRLAEPTVIESWTQAEDAVESTSAA